MATATLALWHTTACNSCMFTWHSAHSLWLSTGTSETVLVEFRVVSTRAYELQFGVRACATTARADARARIRRLWVGRRHDLTMT